MVFGFGGSPAAFGWTGLFAPPGPRNWVFVAVGASGPFPHPREDEPAARQTAVGRQYELHFSHPHEGLRFSGLADDERLLAEYQVPGFLARARNPLFAACAMCFRPAPCAANRLKELEHGARVEVVGSRRLRATAPDRQGICLRADGRRRWHDQCHRPAGHLRPRPARGARRLRFLGGGKLAKDDAP